MSLIRKAFLNIPALGVIFRSNSSLGQGIKQRGFADVGQAYNATLQTHKNL
jgi:hypothetical protein